MPYFGPIAAWERKRVVLSTAEVAPQVDRLESIDFGWELQRNTSCRLHYGVGSANTHF